MNSKDKKNWMEGPLVWPIAFLAVLAAFYGLDHFIMGIQGLPLNFNLTPAQ